MSCFETLRSIFMIRSRFLTFFITTASPPAALPPSPCHSPNPHGSPFPYPFTIPATSLTLLAAALPLRNRWSGCQDLPIS
ncbi:hypothetical protein O3P69_000790 [Scylla paramamosain]|uniref:Uncharacterized protein n=1 Tax=Scylla paramamosain TaxID=85552 RepID=A0AAW0UVV6_SCYPA